MEIIPKPEPAHPSSTRTQALWWSSLEAAEPSRSQWKRTRTRPNSSVWMSPGPMTTALWRPSTRGHGVRSGGRTLDWAKAAATRTVQGSLILPSMCVSTTSRR